MLRGRTESVIRRDYSFVVVVDIRKWSLNLNKSGIDMGEWSVSFIDWGWRVMVRGGGKSSESRRLFLCSGVEYRLGEAEINIR